MLGGQTFYGANIDGKVLWGKFKGDLDALVSDLAAKLGMDVEVSEHNVAHTAWIKYNPRVDF
jgi:hypothetical protein